jgi:hypothetical protein
VAAMVSSSMTKKPPCNFPFDDHHISDQPIEPLCPPAAKPIHDGLQLQISGVSVRISTRGYHAKTIAESSYPPWVEHLFSIVSLEIPAR